MNKNDKMTAAEVREWVAPFCDEVGRECTKRFTDFFTGGFEVVTVITNKAFFKITDSTGRHSTHIERHF